MPNCYFVNDYRQSETAVIDDPAPNRSDYGLPPQRAVFPGNLDHPVGDAVQATPVLPGGQRNNRDQTPKQEGEGEAQEGSGGGGGGGGDESRAAAGGEGVVLCNFNRLHKIDPHTFGAWMEVCSGMEGMGPYPRTSLFFYFRICWHVVNKHRFTSRSKVVRGLTLNNLLHHTPCGHRYLAFPPSPPLSPGSYLTLPLHAW